MLGGIDLVGSLERGFERHVVWRAGSTRVVLGIGSWPFTHRRCGCPNGWFPVIL